MTTEPERSCRDPGPHSGISHGDVVAAVRNETDDLMLWSREEYRNALIEQYRIYVDLTERLALRRATTNGFFLTLNSVVFTLSGVAWSGRPPGLNAWWIMVPASLAIAVCVTWCLTLASFRRLTRAKWLVIAAIEEQLPLRQFVRAEWDVVLRGQRRWVSFSLISAEIVLPVLFAVTYAVAAAGVIGTR